MHYHHRTYFTMQGSSKMTISKRDRNALQRIGRQAATAQAAAMTPAQRKERASHAAKARWAKAKEGK